MGILDKFKELISKTGKSSNSKTTSKKSSFGKKGSKVTGQKMSETFAGLYSAQTRPLIHKIFIFSFGVSLAYSFGKVLGLSLTPAPKQAKVKPTYFKIPPSTLKTDSGLIARRNLFKSSKAKDKVKEKVKRPDALCLESNQRSNIPVRLINTIVLQNDAKSIAAVQISSKKGITPFRTGEGLGNFGKIGKIDRQRIYFRNQNSGKCEYIATAGRNDNFKSQVKVLDPERGKRVLQELEAQKSIINNGNQFEIKRAYLESKLQNIGEILTQAKATPIKNPDGTLSFKISQVEPGGIFATLGVKDNDYISAIDGKAIKSLNQVMTLFGGLKGMSTLELTIKREGISQKFKYAFIE